jgi:hypothetical protein
MDNTFSRKYAVFRSRKYNPCNLCRQTIPEHCPVAGYKESQWFFYCIKHFTGENLSCLRDNNNLVEAYYREYTLDNRKRVAQTHLPTSAIEVPQTFSSQRAYTQEEDEEDEYDSDDSFIDNEEEEDEDDEEHSSSGGDEDEAPANSILTDLVKKFDEEFGDSESDFSYGGGGRRSSRLATPSAARARQQEGNDIDPTITLPGKLYCECCSKHLPIDDFSDAMKKVDCELDIRYCLRHSSTSAYGARAVTKVPVKWNKKTVRADRADAIESAKLARSPISPRTPRAPSLGPSDGSNITASPYRRRVITYSSEEEEEEEAEWSGNEAYGQLHGSTNKSDGRGSGKGREGYIPTPSSTDKQSKSSKAAIPKPSPPAPQVIDLTQEEGRPALSTQKLFTMSVRSECAPGEQEQKLRRGDRGSSDEEEEEWDLDVNVSSLLATPTVTSVTKKNRATTQIPLDNETMQSTAKSEYRVQTKRRNTVKVKEGQAGRKASSSSSLAKKRRLDESSIFEDNELEDSCDEKRQQETRNVRSKKMEPAKRTRRGENAAGGGDGGVRKAVSKVNTRSRSTESAGRRRSGRLSKATSRSNRSSKAAAEDEHELSGSASEDGDRDSDSDFSEGTENERKSKKSRPAAEMRRRSERGARDESPPASTTKTRKKTGAAKRATVNDDTDDDWLVDDGDGEESDDESASSSERATSCSEEEWVDSE